MQYLIKSVLVLTFCFTGTQSYAQNCLLFSFWMTNKNTMPGQHTMSGLMKITFRPQ